jgi:hypothetical protein
MLGRLAMLENCLLPERSWLTARERLTLAST